MCMFNLSQDWAIQHTAAISADFSVKTIGAHTDLRSVEQTAAEQTRKSAGPCALHIVWQEHFLPGSAVLC